MALEQGTNEWLEWRKSGIGSSDAPVVMGVSPYKTPHKLYLEKTGQQCDVPDPGKVFIFERGHKVERQARAQLEIIHGGVEFRPGLAQMIGYPFLRASMDGANFEYEGGVGKEFKLVSKKEFDAGVCPVRYYPQVMHQYLVTGLKRIDIVLCCEVGKLKVLKVKEVEVPLDLEYIHIKLVPALFDFWWRVQNRVPPELVSGDAQQIKDKGIIEKIKKHQSSRDKILKLYDKKEKIEKEIEMLRLGRQRIESDIAHWLPDGLWYYGKGENKKHFMSRQVKELVMPNLGEVNL